LSNKVAEDPEIIKKISRAISITDTVLEINEDNTAKIGCSIDRAVERNISFAVRPKPLMFILDLDEIDLIGNFNLFCEEIKGMGCDPVVSESGTPGHMHLICKTDSNSQYELLSDISKRFNLDKSIRRNFIRPPGSPHRKKLPIRIVSHNNALQILEALGSYSGEIDIPYTLSRKIKYADGLGVRYKSGSELTQAIVNQSYNNGIGVLQLYDILRNPINKGGEALRSRIKSKGSKSAIRWLELSYNKAAQYKSSSEDIIYKLKVLESVLINDLKWTGKSGLTDRDLMLAHILVARKSMSLKYKASLRMLASIANIGSLITVRKSNERLQEMGFLKKLKKSKGNLSNSWEIVCNESNTINTMGGCDYNVSFARHLHSEAFAWALGGVRGLGKAGVPVMDVLALEGQLRASEVASRTGLSRQTVYRVLRRLLDVGFLLSKDRIWEINWDKISLQLKNYCAETGITTAKENLIRIRREESRINRNKVLSYHGCKKIKIEYAQHE